MLKLTFHPRKTYELLRQNAARPLVGGITSLGKKVFLGTPTPEDHHIVALYSALEDKTRELRVMTLKLALLAEHEPTAWAISAYHPANAARGQSVGWKD